MLRKLLIVTCLSSIVFVAFGQKKKKSREQVPQTITEDGVNYKELGSPLPDLKIFTREGKYLTGKDLKNDAHLILMLFNPTCDHCEQQTFNFQQNIPLFTKTHLVLLAAPNMGPYLTYFTNNTKFDSYPPVFRIGVDSSEYIEKTFRQVTLPQINIYDKQRKLVKMFYGVTPMDSLKQYID